MDPRKAKQEALAAMVRRKQRRLVMKCPDLFKEIQNYQLFEELESGFVSTLMEGAARNYDYDDYPQMGGWDTDEERVRRGSDPSIDKNPVQLDDFGTVVGVATIVNSVRPPSPKAQPKP